MSIEYSVTPDLLNDKARLDAFYEDLNTPITEHTVSELASFYSHRYQEHRRLIESGNPEYYQATGEVPITTKYDALQSPTEWLPDELVSEALAIGHLDERILLHPSRVQSLRAATEKEFIPTAAKDIPAVDKFATKGVAVHSSAFAFRVVSTRVAENEGLHPETSARKILCDGLWVHTTDNDVTMPIILNSTPDNVSAHAIAKMAALQGRSFVPIDSIWNDVNNQIAMYRRAVELLQADPVLSNHPDKQYLLERAQKLIGVTLKANPHDAIRRMEELYEEGVRSVRVYEPRGRSDKMVDTVRALRDRNDFKDLTIITGNVTDVEDAKALAAAGSNAVSFVLGGGGICATPGVARIAVENIGTAHALAKANLSIPTIADSGTGDTYAILAGAGTSGFMKGQGICSGLEKSPYLKWHLLRNGQWASNFSGEAGKRTKLLGGKIDYLGRPLFVEGDDTYITWNDKAPSIASNLYLMYQDLATAVLFSRHGSLEELRQTPVPHIVGIDESAARVGSIHHDTNGNGR